MTGRSGGTCTCTLLFTKGAVHACSSVSLLSLIGTRVHTMLLLAVAKLAQAETLLLQQHGLNSKHGYLLTPASCLPPSSTHHPDATPGPMLSSPTWYCTTRATRAALDDHSNCSCNSCIWAVRWLQGVSYKHMGALAAHPLLQTYLKVASQLIQCKLGCCTTQEQACAAALHLNAASRVALLQCYVAACSHPASRPLLLPPQQTLSHAWRNLLSPAQCSCMHFTCCQLLLQPAVLLVGVAAAVPASGWMRGSCTCPGGAG